VRVAVLLATVPVEQAAAHSRLQSNIKPKIFLASFMPDAPSGLFLKLIIFSAFRRFSRWGGAKIAIIRLLQWMGRYFGRK
jgi:hypothetical protein